MEKRRLRQSDLYILLFMAVLALRLFFWFSPSHADKMSMTYLWPLAVSMIVFALCLKPSERGRGAIAAVLLSVWFWLTCVLNGDAYLEVNGRFLLGVTLTFGVSYPVFLVTGKSTRGGWFRALSAFYVVLMTGMALLGLYATAAATSIRTPFSDLAIGVRDSRLYYFQYHPNEAASALSIALFLALYLAMGAKRAVSRVAAWLAAAALYAAVSLTVSRTVMITVSLALGAWVFLTAMRALGLKKRVVRAAVSLALAALVAAAAFLGFSPVMRGVANWPGGLAENASAEATAPVQPAPAKGQAPRERDITRDFSTFTGRTEIWKAGFQYIAERPVTLLTGELDSEVARIPVRLLGRDVYHLHNAWLELLVLTGLPGLLLYLCLALGILRGSLWLLAAPGVPLCRRFLAFVPPLLMVNGLMEIYPCLSGNVMDMMFMAVSGAVVGYAGEIAGGKPSLRRLIQLSKARRA